MTTCSISAVNLPPHQNFQQQLWRNTVIEVCSKVAVVLHLHRNFRQQLWLIAAIAACSTVAVKSTVLGVVHRLLLVLQQIIGSIMSQPPVPSTDTPNTNGLPVRVENHQDGNLLN